MIGVTYMIEKAYDNLIHILRKFTNNTNRTNEDDIKRTVNYLEWNSLKTDIINTEKEFVLPNNIDDIVKRCNVIWVHFGFNIGSEFGGHHPAIVVRKMGNAVYVIPLDSGNIPEDKKDKGYLIPIRYVYNFQKMPRFSPPIILKYLILYHQCNLYQFANFYHCLSFFLHLNFLYYYFEYLNFVDQQNFA